VEENLSASLECFTGIDEAVPYFSVSSFRTSTSLSTSTTCFQLIEFSQTRLPTHIPIMAPVPMNSKRIDEAQKLAKSDPSKAEAIYKDILSKGPGSGEAALREYETALMGLGEIYRDQENANELAKLVTTSRSTLSSFAKAKTAKLGMYDIFVQMKDLLLTIDSPTAS